MVLEVYLCTGKLENGSPYKGIMASPRDRVESRVIFDDCEILEMRSTDPGDLIGALFQKIGISDEQREEDMNTGYLVDMKVIHAIKGPLFDSES